MLLWSVCKRLASESNLPEGGRELEWCYYGEVYPAVVRAACTGRCTLVVAATTIAYGRATVVAVSRGMRRHVDGVWLQITTMTMVLLASCGQQDEE